MKKIFAISVLLLAALLLLPLCAFETQENTTTKIAVSNEAQIAAAPQNLKVLISETGEIKEMAVSDYLFGVLAGEMPALYEEEALKAQAVCAYTFTLWRQKGNKDKDYDITDNYKVDQCYITEESAREKWGSHADEYVLKLQNVIADTQNEVLTYNGEIILSVYHAVSGGSTESAENVWGGDYPYLQSVSSVGDKLAKNYLSQAEFTAEEIKKAFESTEEITKNPFTDFKRTDAGTVKTVKFCGKEYKGSEIREKLDLKSSNFETEFKDGKVIFTVYGYGHGVGMSQNGANYMAQQGSDYKEILAHYYKGTTVMQNS